jgi:hypothetical protein
VLVDVTVTVGE